MSPDEARELFSEAYEGLLAPPAREAFDAALEADAALREEYEGFASLLREVRASARHTPPPEVDLLGGVQGKLRRRSRGRYYRDRFAARSGTGLTTPLVVATVMALVLVAAWVFLSR